MAAAWCIRVVQDHEQPKTVKELEYALGFHDADNVGLI